MQIKFEKNLSTQFIFVNERQHTKYMAVQNTSTYFDWATRSLPQEWSRWLWVVEQETISSMTSAHIATFFCFSECMFSNWTSVASWLSRSSSLLWKIPFQLPLSVKGPHWLLKKKNRAESAVYFIVDRRLIILVVPKCVSARKGKMKTEVQNCQIKAD